MGALEPESQTPAASLAARRQGLVPFLIISAVVAAGMWPLLQWQKAGQRRAESLTRLRRLANAALVYAQDWDGRMMAPALQLPEGRWQVWNVPLKPYVGDTETFLNPANPFFGSGLSLHPKYGYPVPVGYALNRRVWGTFGPGPFPMENLELPAQTVLFVEAGPMLTEGPSNPNHREKIALPDYDDTLETPERKSLWPFPSLHDGKMAVVAADGHTLILKVEHYSSADGPHDPLYGRLGADIYNWNGGHPNGQTDRPAHE